jgi:hypothetical protein
MVLGSDKSIVETVSAFLSADPIRRGGSFGGAECAAYVDPNIRIAERIIWLIVCISAFWFLSLGKRLAKLKDFVKQDLALTSIHPIIRGVELFAGCLCVGIFLAIFLYKLNSNSLCFIFQPCHLIILSQGLALIRDDEISVLSQLLVLPSLGGTVVALLFPETDDLIQPFEENMFWIEHFTLQLLPLYLLLRRNGLILKHVSAFTALTGAWVLMTYHFAIIDVRTFQIMTHCLRSHKVFVSVSHIVVECVVAHKRSVHALSDSPCANAD